MSWVFRDDGFHPPIEVGCMRRGYCSWDAFPVRPVLQATCAHCMDHQWPSAVGFLSSLCEA